MDLSVILPAFDEERRLRAGIEAVLSHLGADGRPYELLVVDDGSADGTADLAREYEGSHPEVRLLTHERNRGKGAAVRTGALAATGDLVLFADVDQSTPVAELAKLEEAIAGGADLAIASREVVGARRVKPQPFHRRAMGYLFMVLRDLIVLPEFIDTQCGFKLMTKEASRMVFSRSRLDGYCFDVEILAIAAHLGMSIREVPVDWTDDPESKVSPLRDSTRMLADLWRIRRNRRRGLYDAG